MKPSTADVHPELRQIAGKMGAINMNASSLWLMRILSKVLIRPLKMPPGIQVRNTFITVNDPQRQIRLRIYQAQDKPANAPGLLWMHGGGMIGGAPELDDAYVLPFVQETGALVVSVDYRLAPDYPYPAALEDCFAALQWLATQAQSLGVDQQRIAIGGDSAGSGLAASLAQLAHESGGVQPIFQLLVYPMLDDRTAARKDIQPDGHFAWTNTSNRFGWESYLKQPVGTEIVPAGSVPARQADLSGLPPAWIGVGTLDLFHDEDVAYAQRLQEAGVPCELVIVPGAFHGFDVNLGGKTPQPPVVKAFRQSQVQALKKAFRS